MPGFLSSACLAHRLFSFLLLKSVSVLLVVDWIGRLNSLLFQCLRDHLSLPGHDSCPSCSVKASDSHIKRVPAIEEVVTRWKEARPALLDLLALQNAQSTASTSKVPSDKVNGKKRKLDSPVVESRKKKGKSKAVESDSDIEEIVDPTNRT